jgi:hypothetical protein
MSMRLLASTSRTPDGRVVRNLLYSFEGCFDTR